MVGCVPDNCSQNKPIHPWAAFCPVLVKASRKAISALSGLRFRLYPTVLLSVHFLRLLRFMDWGDFNLWQSAGSTYSMHLKAVYPGEQRLSILATLTENSSSAPVIHTGQIIIACNSISSKSDALFWLQTCIVRPLPPTYMHIKTNK